MTWSAREERQPSKIVKRTCGCETCKRDRNEPNAIHEGTVHSYSALPEGGWKFLRAPGEGSYMGGSRLLFMGIELETDLSERRGGPRMPVEPPYPHFADSMLYEERQQISQAYDDSWLVWDRSCRDAYREYWKTHNRMSAEEATSLAVPAKAWLPKHDGSVSGPEFVSQPATMAWWNSKQDEIKMMLDGLLHAGLHSHQGDHCGMHVNINTNTFESGKHLFQFATLLIDNRAWATKMSQRTQSSLHWCEFDEYNLTNPMRRLRWADRAVDDGWAEQDRYAVLNANNTDRIEFRLPRGTLRLDRFYKNLEWVAAMVEYTQTRGVELRASAFMRWAMSNRVQYPNLCAFIDEKFAAKAIVKGAAISAAGSVFAEMSGAFAFATGR